MRPFHSVLWSTLWHARRKNEKTTPKHAYGSSASAIKRPLDTRANVIWPRLLNNRSLNTMASNASIRIVVATRGKRARSLAFYTRAEVCVWLVSMRFDWLKKNTVLLHQKQCGVAWGGAATSKWWGQNGLPLNPRVAFGPGRLRLNAGYSFPKKQEDKAQYSWNFADLLETNIYIPYACLAVL